jgi:type 1 glutamine amidotransferase
VKTRNFIVAIVALFCAASASQAAEKLKVLIIDGQNNHNWKACTPVLKAILEECGRFTVDVSTSPPAAPALPKNAKAEDKKAHAETVAKWKAEKDGLWKQWRPKFSDYQVLLSNYNGERWTEEVDKAFVEYVRNGGGLVIIHAADNSFANWPEYNEMIAVGGWGGRNEKSGPMIRWRDGKQILDTTPGGGGTHGAACPYVVNIIMPDHPITKGLPSKWLHAKDELYGKLRGPCKNVTVLANAMSNKETRGTGEIEPILMTIDYGKGRVFHDVLGHGPDSMVDVGFQVTLQRGAEWAATGKVTLPLPKTEDMSAEKVVERVVPGIPAAK